MELKPQEFFTLKKELSNIKIFVNPIDDLLFIYDLKLRENMQLIILDFKEQIVMEIDNFESNNSIDISMLPTGTYAMQIRKLNAVLYRKSFYKY